MTAYAGYTESAEAIEARKRRILATPNLAVDEIPPAGECSPMYYAAMTPEQRAEYDKRLDAFIAERKAKLAQAQDDRLGFALAQKKMYEGISPLDVSGVCHE